ncbi:hypothetical protein ELH93_03410 [Rhizobium leguminosarum]|uniref:hypothetical protein n=1 Tax=Rhizobium leguminosarum TaxID=384 RepID=UPI00102FD363|nr:hypothetical protein [Rhizobium leguminosarum]TAY31731.1 hypothetical protein ELH93_03410 [Rhizobium leguminosarum]
MLDKPELIYPSLTPLVVQVRWKVPTEFPACPDEFTDDALLLYASRLSFGSVFARNQFSTSLIIDHRLRDDDLVVLTRFAGDSIKDWAVAHISVHDGHFHHRSEYTFYTLHGALKHFCELVGEEFGSSMDDFC